MTLRAFVGQLIAILAMGVAMPASADTHDEVQTTWRLLDYIAVDYIEAVEDGKVTNELEYAEMQEFSASVVERMAALPANAQRAQLVADAEALAEAISAKVEPAVVARDARRLANELIAAFPVPLAPDAVPDLARGAALYAQSCASCHGVSGDGAGPAAEGLDPPPIAFDDVARARERSAFALYQVIGQGLEGTAMPGFSDLPAEDRWSLAYYSGSIAFPEVERGRRIWNDEPAIRARVPDLAALSGRTPAALGEAIGTEQADAVMAYLRAHPEAVASDTTGSLALARERLQQSLAAYEAGNKTEARELALSAYLDGFEPLEAVLSTRDADLLASVEIGMAELRAAISRGDPVAAVAEKVNALDVLFYRAETVLAPANASEASAFLGAFADRDRDDRVPAQGRENGSSALRPWRMALRSWGRSPDMGGSDLPDRSEWCGPRAGGGVRIAFCRSRPAVGRHMDARQVAGRRMATLYPENHAARSLAQVRMVSVRAGVSGGLSGGL